MNQQVERGIENYPEIKSILELLPYDDQVTITDLFNMKLKELKKVNKLPELSLHIVTAIYKAEIPLTTEIIIFGATLAILQGQLTEFNTQIGQVKTQNPAIYNLLTLEALILKGDNYQAFSWISKSLHVYLKLKKSDSNYELKDIIKGEEIFTHSLAYYCYELMGKTEEAGNAFEEASRLHAINDYKWNYYYFWLIYFKARIAIEKNYQEEAHQYIEEALNISIDKVPHRIYQALTLQLKGYEEQAGIQLATALVEAGLKVDKDVFVQLFEKIYKGNMKTESNRGVMNGY